MRDSLVAYVPDEAVKCGREISLAARSLYQIICAYRNRESGECALKDQKRMAEESGINYCHLSTVKKELLEKTWVLQMPNGRLKPIFGTFDKPKTSIESKEVVESLDKPNSLDKSKSLDNPNTVLSFNQSPTLDKPKGTKVAIKGNISSTNNNLPTGKKHKPSAAHPDFHKLKAALVERVGEFPDYSAQGKAINWLLTVGKFTVEDCIACLDYQIRTFSEGYRVSWLSVEKAIGSWKAQNSRTQQKSTLPTAAEMLRVDW